MKKLSVLLSAVLIAGAASALVVFEDNFSSYNGGSIGGPDWGPKWDTNSVPQQADLITATNGIATLDTSNATQNYHVPSKHAFTMTGSDERTIIAKVRLVHAGGGNGGTTVNKSFFSLMLSNTNQWWTGQHKSKSLVNRNGAIGLAHNNTGGAGWVEGWTSYGDFGLNTTTGGTGDWVTVKSDLIVSNATIWIDADVFNESGTKILDGTVMDTGLSEGSDLYAGLTTGYIGTNTTIETATKISAILIDNFYVGTEPFISDTMIWSDNLDTLGDGANLAWRSPWKVNFGATGVQGTNGYAIQRPNVPGSTGGGWNGFYVPEALSPAVDESIVIEFDWRLYTDGTSGVDNYLDIGVTPHYWTTGGAWGDRPMMYATGAKGVNHEDAAMSYRIQKLNGSGDIRPQFFEVGLSGDPNPSEPFVNMTAFDDSVLGLDSASGDTTGDWVRVTYTLEKTAKENVWFADLSFSNKVTGATHTMATMKVENEDWYTNSNFYFYGSVNDALNEGDEGCEYDNFIALIRAKDPENALPDGVIIDEDFDSMVDGEPLDADREWDPLNATGGHFDVNDGKVTCWPSTGHGINWRGEMNTFSTITGVEVGDTVEVEFDTEIYIRQAKNDALLDVILSSVYTNAGTSYDNANVVGVRYENQAGGQLRFRNTAANFNTMFTNLWAGSENVGTTDWCRVSYSFEKTSTPDTWNVDMAISNMTSGFSAELTDVSVTAANAYNASELYFGFYGASSYGNTNGLSVDNLLVTHIVPPLGGFDAFVDSHGLSGDPNDDADSDLLTDWGEYVFGGDPNDPGDAGTQPHIAGTDYVFSVIGDDALTATVLTNINLVAGSWGVHDTIPITSSSEMLEAYTNNVGSAAGNVFIKLEVNQ